MTIIKNILICTILVLMSCNANASTNDYSNDDLLSVPSKELLPFHEPSWYFKHGYGDIEMILSEDHPEKSKVNSQCLTMTIGMNKPVYEHYLSAGFNISINISFTNMEDTKLKIKDITGEDLNNNFFELSSYYFPLFLSLDAGLSLKGSIPLFDRAAITTGIDGGLSSLLSDATKIIDLKSDRIIDPKRSKGGRSGLFSALSIGAEFYPIEWVGIYAGWQSRHYYFGSSSMKSDEEKEGKFLEKEKKEDLESSPFSKSINNIWSFGVLFTF